MAQRRHAPINHNHTGDDLSVNSITIENGDSSFLLGISSLFLDYLTVTPDTSGDAYGTIWTGEVYIKSLPGEDSQAGANPAAGDEFNNYISGLSGTGSNDTTWFLGIVGSDQFQLGSEVNGGNTQLYASNNSGTQRTFTLDPDALTITSDYDLLVGSDYVPVSSGTTGGTGSAGSGNQYVELEVNGTVYKVLHDGTV